MKILYFHQHFQIPTQAGGTRSYEMARALIARGHQVTMVCGETAKLHLAPVDGSPRICRGDVDGIDVVQIALPYSNKDNLLRRSITFCRFAWQGIKVAMREDYDLLFATSTPLTAGIPGIVVKLFRRKKFVFEVRDLWPELPKALGMRNPFLLGGMSLLEYLCYHCADSCIGLSPGICRGIARRSQRNKAIRMIPNGCDLKIFSPENRCELKLPGVNSGDITAIFTGAHGNANGLDRVLDAAAVLKKRNRTDVKLLFVGDGKLKPALRERARQEELDNCLFFDPVPKVELNRIIASSDIGLMILKNVPAFYYGTSPNKFFDYIASGLPVLNNYPGFLADYIREAQCGEAIEPDNAEAFADALIKLADDPELRRQYGRNARRLAETEFAREKLARQFVDFLEQTVTGEYKMESSDHFARTIKNG